MKRTWSKANAQEYGQLGIIESVKLRNFMCHDNLSFDFDPHINFIIGRNGSGKSAILTGIILALGGKSSATGRFCNIKGFVKTGKNTASVSVTLKNCGHDAYKPDVYGEKITIERYFTLDGVNTYKLKSESGQIVSSSKEELTNILNVMDIQIDNPIAVLVQDTSKNFLVSKNSKGDKLFKLFYDGTNLSKVYDDYKRALQQSEDAKSELKNKKVILLDMEKDMKKIKALLDKSAKINELEKELLWAIVIQFEKEKDTEVAALENSQNKVTELTTKLDCYKDEIADVSQKMNDAKSEKKALQAKLEHLRKNIQDIDPKKSSLDSEIREVRGTFSRHEREICRIEREILGLEKIIDTIKKQNQYNLDDEKMKYELKIRNLNEEIINTRKSLGALDTQRLTLQKKVDVLVEEINATEAKINDLNNEKSRIERQKQQIIHGMKNRCNVFGPEMENVLTEIKNGIESGIFKEPPIGPIGQYIDVKKPVWTFAIQECLNISFLKSFLCDNHEDEKQLSNIFSRHYTQSWRPCIIISKFALEVYDVSAHKCVSNYPTVLDMIDVEIPVVANCLIDQKQIENILLVDDPKEARNLTLDNPPRKCNFIYSCNGDQFCHSPPRKYSCRKKNKFCILKSFQKDDIKKKEEEIKRVDGIMSEIMQYKENLLQKKSSIEEEIKKITYIITQKKLEEKDLHRKIQDEESCYAEPKDINSFLTDLNKFKKSKADHEERLHSFKAVLTNKTDELNQLNQELEIHKRNLKKETDNFCDLSKRMEEYQNKKESRDSSCKNFKSKLAQLQQDLKVKEVAVANCNGIVKVSTDRALRACPRVDTERSAETIRHLLNEMKNFLQRQKNVDRESLFREYEEKVEKFNTAKVELRRQEKINDRLVHMIAQRFEEFKKICQNTSVALTCTFSTLLKEHDFSGYPVTCFEKKRLDIFAKPVKSQLVFGNMPNLCQLSGGERSFVTVAFLLALWERIHSPFRILDEYDVFMDSNNRHRSINLLINTANVNKKIQYIFLSPLELPPIKYSNNVKVHKMTDPRD